MHAPNRKAKHDGRGESFLDGRSPAARLPQAFRVDAEQMRIKRRGRRIIFEPVESNWSWLDTLTPLDSDAVDAACESPTE